MDKDFMVGDAARRGIAAALLAKRGLSGASNILEGPRGFCHTLADKVDLSATLRDLGQKFTIMNQYLKPYPSCRHTHATIDAVRAVLKKRSIDVEDLESLTIYLNEHAAAIAMSAPTSYVGVRFSQQFAAAVTLLTGQATLNQFTEEMARNPSIEGLIRKTAIKVDPVLDGAWPENWSSRVEIRLNNGESILQQIDKPKGDIDNPMNEDELLEKYRSLLMEGVSESWINRVMEKVQTIDDMQDINELTSILVF